MFPAKLRERVRTGFPDPSEPEMLAEHSPAWLAEMVRFAYATGWRRGELLWRFGGNGSIGRSGRSGCRTRRTTRGESSRSRESLPRSWSGYASGGR